MISYRAELPLIFIHIPKCAGTSVKQIVRVWFGEGFHTHYLTTETREPPHIVDFRLQSERVPQVVYGHFNSMRGFGINDSYPKVTQFCTILRDPLEVAISDYFYKLKIARPLHKRSIREIALWALRGGLKPKSRAAARDHRKNIRAYSGVEDYILSTDSHILDHFPVKMTETNYEKVIETMFVEIGVVEHLDETLTRIARALGKKLNPDDIPHLNKSPRTHAVSREVEAEFRAKNVLAYKVYDYVRARFNSSTDGDTKPAA